MQSPLYDLPALLVGAGLIISLVTLKVVYDTIYNIYFHPLRKFPGPILAAATRYYWMGITFGGRRHIYTKQWHEKYGDVVRVGPYELSFIGETAWRDIYAHKQGRGQMQKWGSFNPGQKAYHIQNAPDDVHARQRKMLSHAFSDRALREQEGLIKVYIDLLSERLREYAKRKTAVDISAALNWTTFDIIGDLSFAESFHNLELRRLHPFLTTVFRSVRTIVALNQLNTIPFFSFLIELMIKLTQAEGGFPFIEYSRKLVDKRIKQGTSRPDFMSRILEHNRDDGTGITKDEIDATMAILVIAGSETTATLLSGCFYLLLRNPEKLKKLREEILAEFSSVDEITIMRVSHLPYLFGVLEESLRVYPPIPISFPRIVPPEGASICGHWIHGGTVVGVPQHAAYHSVSNFIEPEKFLPERWLPNKDEMFTKDRTSVLQPFSTGPRNCLGKNLAYAEMELMLARLVFEFDFQLDDEKFDWINQRVFTLWEKPPLMLRLNERVTS